MWLTAVNLIAVVGFIIRVSATEADCGEAPQTVLYWGQNGETDLAKHCSSDLRADVIVLAFLHQFGNGNVLASGNIGTQCVISNTGEPSGCQSLANAIKTCQTNGVKIFLSLGGAVGEYSLTSEEEALKIGQNLWDAYGNSDSETVPRPFGSVYVNGWDFNIERVAGNEHYPALVKQLRHNFADDNANQYYLSSAPQCPIPDINVSDLINSVSFDYLWVQFYNNPACSKTGEINYDEWVSQVATAESADAKIFLGVPAAPLAASDATYYFGPQDLASLVSKYNSSPSFGGVMMWSAAHSDNNVSGGCTYAQQVSKILKTGSPC